ncbi:Unknown protein [Striga hermonthica]|uniref:hAT-like transposase RNase-H fold domain-containing protein n=1 Tax=Striga hermonthica TaxID=68872 RepID=A0A9N7MY76_STRHE|nr:Unknown protein [Striga hermonthica]
MEPPEKLGHPGLVTGAQKSAKDSGTRNKMMLPSSVANQSYSVSASSPAHASTLIPSFEGSLVPSEAADGGATQESHDAINVDSDVEEQPVTKKAKKTTSEVWQYFTKYWVTVEEIMEYYSAERDKLYEYFKTIQSRFSATMDMWKSNQNKGYVCVTLHWVDDDWKIQKRISISSMLKGDIPTAFARLTSIDRHRYGSIAPSYHEWDKAQILIPFLKKFFELTEIFSGTTYPTANLFFRGFCEIKILLADWCISKDTTICGMANAMSVKFDKYWKKSNIALAVANFLDPRFKRRIVKFYLRKFYNNSYQAELEKFNGILRKMFQCYVSAAPSSSKSNKEVEEPLADLFMGSNNIDDELDNYLFESDSYDADGGFSELERYLAEPPLKTTKANQNMFDILAWWKSHKEEYHDEFSEMGRDDDVAIDNDDLPEIQL